MLPTSGNISTSLDTIYSPKTTGYIKNIKFNNTDNTDWNFELYQYDNTTKNSTLLYKYELLAGQIINDNSEYIIPFGSSLRAKSDVSTVVFMINGTEP